MGMLKLSRRIASDIHRIPASSAAAGPTQPHPCHPQRWDSDASPATAPLAGAGVLAQWQLQKDVEQIRITAGSEEMSLVFSHRTGEAGTHEK